MIAATLALLFLAIVFSEEISSLGYKFTVVGDAAYDYQGGVLLAGFFSIVIFFINFKYKKAVWLFWLLKLLIALLVLCYLEGFMRFKDSLYYYNIAGKIDDPAFAPMNFTGNITGIVYLLRTVGLESFRSVSVFFMFFGFLVQLFLAYSLNSFSRSKLMFFLPLLAPSLLFWTSVIGKEQLVLLILILSFHSIYYVLNKGKFYQSLFTAIAVCILLIFTRYWLLAVFVPVYILSLLVVVTNRRWGIPWKKAFVALALGFTVIGLSLLVYCESEFMIMSNYLADINAYMSSVEKGGTSNFLHFENLRGLALHYPAMLYTSIVAPMHFVPFSPITAVASLENIAYLIMLVLSVFMVFRDSRCSRIILLLLVMYILWHLLYAPINYGNLGSAIRYKIQQNAIILFMFSFYIREFLEGRKCGAEA